MGIDGEARGGDNSSSSGPHISHLPSGIAAVGSSGLGIPQLPSGNGNGGDGTGQLANVLSKDEETGSLRMEEGIGAKDVSGEVGGRVSARKPWKERKKVAQKNRVAKDEIEIFEGKGMASVLEVTSANKGYLTILCGGDSEFIVPRKVLESFQCLDITLHGDAVFNEDVEDVLRFPEIQPEIMDYVLRFVFIEHLNKLKAAQYWGENSPRLVFEFEVNPLQVMDLIHVAHFLGIQDLLDVTATMIARRLQDVPDLSSMPGDLAWCVAKQFTALELLQAEERQDILSLNLDTDIFWEKHCNKFLKEDIIKPTASYESPPSYQTWGFCEGPPPTSWKALYFALDLQQLADRQDGSTNESFFAEIHYKGNYAYNHTIRPMFYDWVLRAPASLSLSAYLVEFPNLMSLHLVRLPLGSPLPGGEIPCLLLGEILQSHPQLQILDVSETGFTSEAAISLSRSLQSHPRLQVLRLASNSIGTEGFSAIANALPHLRTLKLLDVRDNGIASCIPEDAVLALQSSALEELFLDGNLKSGKQGIANFAAAVADWGFKGMVRRGSGVYWDFRNTASIGEGCGESLVSEPESSHCNSSEAEQKPAGSAVPLLGQIPVTMKKLHLKQCDLVDNDISVLVGALRANTVIQKLDLSDNDITATGASEVFEWLQDSDSLLELNLSKNRITDSCSGVLLTALQSRPKLQKLEMFSNYLYGEDNFPEIIAAAAARGEALVSSCGVRFVLDLRGTEVSHSQATRAAIQRQAAAWASTLHLVI